MPTGQLASATKRLRPLPGNLASMGRSKLGGTPMRRGQRSNKVLATIAATGLVVVGSLGLAWQVGQEPPRTSHVSVELAFTKSCINEYARQFGALPNSIDDVVAEHRRLLAELELEPDSRAPWLKDYPRDPWGTPLRYSPTTPSTDELTEVSRDRLRHDIVPEYRLWSIGPDKIDGTRDDIVAR